MNILIVGPQASGKGTQAGKIAEKYNLAYIEMGRIFRKIIEEDSLLGNEIKKYMEAGILVPDEIVIKVLNEYLARIGILDGIIFDGFPRVLSQAKYFEQFLKERDKKIDLVLYLTLSKEEVLSRLASRRICEKCGSVYNLLTKPPKTDDVCDSCGGKLMIRSDETKEAIEKRLSEFEEKTKPLIKFYKQESIVEEVDGNRPIETIFEDINQRLVKRGLVHSE